jgi:Holliday junction resolvase RusA-like endonuclease
MLYLEINGRVPSKKTSQKIIHLKGTGKLKLLPNPLYSEWEGRAILELKAQMIEEEIETIDYPVNLMALIYRRPHPGGSTDLINLLQSICDVLERSGIIKNDSLIAYLNGSRILPADCPEDERAEIYIFDKPEAQKVFGEVCIKEGEIEGKI